MAYTDKFESGYVEVYQGLSRTLPTDANICEIGVYQGGSLDLWLSLFHQSKTIVGVDINPDARWPEGTLKIVTDQQDPTLPRQLQVFAPDGYHLIVDDASHEGQRTWKTFTNLWPLVKPGGYYVIEDWCVGFDRYPSYDSSMLSMAMMLINLFADHVNCPNFVTYRYGMIIVRKASA